MDMPDSNTVASAFSHLRNELAQCIIGQQALVDRLLIALLADGHLLVEGAPGLAKTTAIKELAARIEADFHRVQFTPDLLPADLTGTEIYRPQTGQFEFQRGPLFHNVILADEVNRAPAKVQSALLEAMGERQITVGSNTFALPPLFLVMATQNPIEQEGTYPLPEAQLDRFLMRISMVSPTKEQERAILQRFMKEEPLETLQSVCTREDILALQKQAKEIYIHPVLLDYMIDLVQATRSWPNIDMGVSPRGSLALVRAVRAYALVRGGAYVVPEDIKTVAVPVLAHRLQLSGSVGSTDAQKKAMTDVLSSVALPTEDWSK